MIQTVCEAIEDAYGRLAPSVYENEVYEKNRMACLQEIINDKHFSEKTGSTFLQVINHKSILASIEGKPSIQLLFVFVFSSFNRTVKQKCECLCVFFYEKIKKILEQHRKRMKQMIQSQLGKDVDHVSADEAWIRFRAFLVHR